MAATCFGFALIQLDVTIVNGALPAIADEFGAGVAGLQWIVDGYALVFASLPLSAGVLADRFGAKRVCGGGMVLFAGASLACGLAGHVVPLIVARAIQGIGRRRCCPPRWRCSAMPAATIRACAAASRCLRCMPPR